MENFEHSKEKKKAELGYQELEWMKILRQLCEKIKKEGEKNGQKNE